MILDNKIGKKFKVSTNYLEHYKKEACYPSRPLFQSCMHRSLKS